MADPRAARARGVSLRPAPSITLEILLIRAFASAGLVLLPFILMIGPMAWLDRRWLPLLYNRRHLGVAMFLPGFLHAALSVATYHAGGATNPIVSIFTRDAGATMGSFPFQAFGFGALLILFVMAATSHDFWLANLTAPVWKTLHMLVYLAYVALVVHVAFGVLQAETSPVYALLMGIGLLAVAGFHLGAGWKQKGLEVECAATPAADGFVPVCEVDDLREEEPLGVTLGGERVAVLRYEGNRISAVSGV